MCNTDLDNTVQELLSYVFGGAQYNELSDHDKARYERLYPKVEWMVLRYKNWPLNLKNEVKQLAINY